ncbi:MAG: glycosyltransferase family 4 protein [Bacteroidetes bacterium]|jgi:glycosyltransferase involved in cell wall biosynthesis|nr:glycosyltransferase family 4 protein [Bacteroidota bacterium]
MGKKLLFVVNVDWFFVSHRLPLALEALKRNHDVYLATKNTGCKELLKQQGIKVIDIDFERSGKNPVKELSLITKLTKIYKEIKPDVVHHITLKPSIYGTIAARKAKSKAKIINAVSGLGYTFTDNRQSLSKVFLKGLLKWAFSDQKSNFIFQNPDDQAFYNQLGFLNGKNFVIIKGSGVDEKEFTFFAPVKKEKLVIVLLARMLKDKGVLEYIEAAHLLKNEFAGNAEFWLVGGIDEYNPAHITEQALKDKCEPGYINWLGHRSDVKNIYEQSDIVCLPSYREGLPKSLIEAMAVGRPIVTTDAIGCKECVDEGINGFKVPVKDHEQLGSRIRTLLLDEDLRLKMGIASREKMVNEFSLKEVVAQTFKLYED